MKEYKIGLICGRFSHIHNGHKLIIDESIRLCDRTVILLGSSQESNTLRNPFSADFRIELIKKVYNNSNIEIVKLPDLTHEYNITHKWGQYVIDKTKESIGTFADLLVSGNDSERRKWFSEKQLEGVTELLIDRTKIKISATELRGELIVNDKENWAKYVPKEIVNQFDEIRQKLLEVPIYQKILEELGQDITIENFKKVYEKYEKEDKEIKMMHNS